MKKIKLTRRDTALSKRLKKILTRDLRSEQSLVDELKPKTTTSVVGECKSGRCHGQIVRVTKTTYEYLGDPMHMMIGPGSRDQLSQVVRVETYCKSCGLLYSNSLKPKTKAARS